MCAEHKCGDILGDLGIHGAGGSVEQWRCRPGGCAEHVSLRWIWKHGQLFGWTIDASGNLSTISGSPYSESFLGGFIGGVGQSNMITNPAGTLMFISDAIGGTIYAFQIGTGGALSPVAGSPFNVPLLTPVFTPMNLATDGLGKYLYVVDGTYSTHTGTKIAAYSIGTGSGGTTLD